jgi:two-component system phosphate regulon response regulator OmpR
MPRSTILVIEDEPNILTTVRRSLDLEGYHVEVASGGAAGLAKLAEHDIDLVLLDVMMPGETGLEFTEALRQGSNVPILMLTARAEVPARIRGLEVGADDYLAKPFEPRELLLRINSILRRGTMPEKKPIEAIRFGPFSFHIERGELKRGSDVVRITDRERDLLRIFAAHPGETVKRQEFLKVSNGGGERAVDVQINRLRRKIEDDPSNPVHLQTARGIGYRLLVD